MRRKNIIISFYLNIGSVDLVAFPKNGQIHMVGLRLSVKDYKANKKLRHFKPPIHNMFSEKSRIRETKNLSTDADSRTDNIFERLHDVSQKRKKRKKGAVDASTRPRDGSTRGRWTLCTHPPFLGLHAWAMDALHPPLVFRVLRV